MDAKRQLLLALCSMLVSPSCLDLRLNEDSGEGQQLAGNPLIKFTLLSFRRDSAATSLHMLACYKRREDRREPVGLAVASLSHEYAL